MIYVIDTETTGTEPPSAAVCEIAAVPVTPDGKVVLSKLLSSLVNPGHKMPCDAQAVHHIGNADLATAPRLDPLMKRQFKHLKGATLAAHVMEFDHKFLAPHLAGNENLICTFRLARHFYPEAPNHQNQTMRYFLDVSPPKSALKGLAPHRAPYDALCTAFVLARMIKDHGYEHCVKLCSAPMLLTTCQLKAHKGKPWDEVPRSYLRWILSADFDQDIRHTAQHYMDPGRRPALCRAGAA